MSDFSLKVTNMVLCKCYYKNQIFFGLACVNSSGPVETVN